jgi:bifunctional non-homologous end joining protein LigD
LLADRRQGPANGPDWIHEIKHDGFRILARRAGSKVKLISRNGHDLTYRFPLVADAMAKLPVESCLIDGEAIICDDNGLAVFQLLRSYRNGHAATLCAFDLIEIDGRDLRRQPIEDRKLTQTAVPKATSRYCLQSAFRRRRRSRVPPSL